MDLYEDVFQDAPDEDNEEDTQTNAEEPFNDVENLDEDLEATNAEGDDNDNDEEMDVDENQLDEISTQKGESSSSTPASSVQDASKDKAAESSPGSEKTVSLVYDENLVNCTSYTLNPTTVFTHGESVNSICASYGTRYLFTGCQDGYIRCYDFDASINGKQPLGLGQKHNLGELVSYSGVLLSYWENEQPLFEPEYKFAADNIYKPQLSPVYALAVQKEALWLCAGLKSGGITLQTVRYKQGQVQAYLEGHTAPVSELILNHPETHLLSGSWDKSVRYWDLNTGQETLKYTLGGQVSSLAWQPLGGPAAALRELNKEEDDADEDKSMGSLFGSDEEGEKEPNGSPARKKPDEEAQVDPQKTVNGTVTNIESKDRDSSDMMSTSVFASTAINGHVDIWDLRSPTKCMQLRGSLASPWCLSMCWSMNGGCIYAGRRNSSIDEYDIRVATNPAHTYKLPSISGQVTCVHAMPNGRELLCASADNLRLYDLSEEAKTRATPFKIVPAFHGATISRMYLDSTGRYMLTASGGRGWQEGSNDLVVAYEVSPE